MSNPRVKTYDWGSGTMTAYGILERQSQFFAMHPRWAGVEDRLPEICVHKIGSIAIKKVDSSGSGDKPLKLQRLQVQARG